MGLTDSKPLAQRPADMASQRLSERIVASLEPPATGRVDYWDEEMPGFGLRISESGLKTWQVMYRVEGRKRRLSLGSYPGLSLELARDAAFEALQQVARGQDPAAARGVVTGTGLSFEGLARAYLNRYAKPKKKSWTADERMILSDLLPVWGRRAADSIARRDVIALIETIQQRGHPYAANRRLALVRKIFTWAVETDMLAASPVINVKPPAEEQPRQRILTDNEVAVLWQAWEQMNWPYGPLFKLALLTGQRRGDVACLRLMDVGLADQVWSVPRGDGRPHDVPLPPLAIEVLASLPRTDSPYAFPGTRGSARPASGFSKATQKATSISGVTGWRLGDLRRTAAAGMARQGTAPEVLNRILDRRPTRSQGLEQIVQSSITQDDLRQALARWAEHVGTLAEAGRTLWHPGQSH